MGETSSQDSRKPLLDVGIIATLTVVANHYLPANQHTEATTIIPFVGGGIAWAIRQGIHEFRKRTAYRELVALETKWLNEAIIERDRSGISRRRRDELEADIAERRLSLQKLQRDNIKIQ